MYRLAASERLDEVVYVLFAPHREHGQVDPRGPPFRAIEQHTEVVGADLEIQPVVQQKGGFFLCEGEFLGADLGQFSPGPQPSQMQRRSERVARTRWTFSGRCSTKNSIDSRHPSSVANW
jgi:hypothetical protein